MNSLSHVALLCRSVDRAAAKLVALGFSVGTRDIFEGEGTAEIYVGDAAKFRGRLLLMEAVKDGAYKRALEKRGPGLHHIAVDVPDMTSFLKTISGSGWLLHPRSLESYGQYKAVYMARPGFPALIEVQERPAEALPAFVTRLEISAPLEEAARLVRALAVPELDLARERRSRAKLGERVVDLEDLCHA